MRLSLKETVMTSQYKKDFGFKRVWEVLKDTAQQMRDGELQLVAGSLSFSTALGLIPFIAIVLAIFQSIGGLEALYPKVEALLLSNLREAAGSNVSKFIRIFLKNINAGKLGTTGVVLLVLTSARLLHDMEMGINRVWNQKLTRPFYKRLVYQWTIILGIPLFLAVYVAFNSLEQFLFVRRVIPAYAANAAVLVGSLFLIYKLVPALKVHTKAAFISALVTAGVIFGVHKGFVLVTTKVFNYNSIYGAFSAIPLLFLWILSMWYVILMGVAFCAGLQKRHMA